MENSSQSSQILIPNLAVLVFVACGLINNQAPLKSDRPADRATMASNAKSRVALARLWQDPYSAKFADASRNVRAKSRLEDLIAGDNSAAPILALPIFTHAGPYAEEVEDRRRARYAIISALGRAQYIPDDGTHLRAVRQSGEDLPYELFVPRRIRNPDRLEFGKWYSAVVVIWLNEEELFRQARRKAPQGGDEIAPELLDRVRSNVREVVGAETMDRVEIKAIGPTSSETLEAMVERTSVLPPKEAPRGMLFVARATADSELINRGAQVRGNGLKTHSTLAGWQVERTIATDNMLVAEALDELKLRWAKPSTRKHLVLVSEWDSVYSRDLTISFQYALAAKSPASPGPAPLFPDFVHRYSYLKGIDGQALQAVAAPESGKPVSPRAQDGDEKGAGPLASLLGGESRKPSSDDDPDRAVGQAQLDYLRRLTTQLELLQRQLSYQREEIGSIGVLGSDPFDKLLVLRALKNSFPRAIFFTTDLSALYLDPQEFDYTRNLIVCSGEDLTATPEVIQGDIPPFRDNYQTSLFLTCLKALNLKTVDGAPFEPGKSSLRFEVGRKEMHRLPHAVERDSHWFSVYDGVTLIGAWAEQSKLLHPFTRLRLVAGLEIITLALLGTLSAWIIFYQDPESSGKPTAGSAGFWKPWIWTNLWAAAAVGFFALVAVFLRSAPDYTEPLLISGGFLAAICYCYHRAAQQRPIFGPRFAKVLSFLPVLGILILIFQVAAIHLGANEELWSLFDGVSIWPTDLLRVATIQVGVTFILLVHRRLENLKKEIAEKYKLGPFRHRPNRCLARRHWRYWPRVFWLQRTQRGSMPHPIRRVWHRYLVVAQPDRRGWRMAVGLLAIMGMMAVASFAIPLPVTPARGNCSNALDHAMQYLSVLVYLVLLVGVIDIAFLAGSFVKELRVSVIDRAPPQRPSDCDKELRLINDLTGEVATFVYFPFSLLFMIVVARSDLFDAWDWPVFLIILLGCGLVTLFIAVAVLQHQASQARHLALNMLNRLIDEAQGSRRGQKPAIALGDLRERREAIVNLDSLVFQPWYHNPVLSAVLIPLGGVGSLQLLEKILPYFQ